MKIQIKNILKIIISLVFLTLVLVRVDFSQIWKNLQYLSFYFVIFALLYYALCQCLSCLRWQIILQSTGYSVSMGTLLSSYFGGMFLNTFLPGTIGGDVYRIYRINRKIGESESAFVSVFLERIMGISALLAMALISFPLSFSLVGRWDIILLLFICTIILLGCVMLVASPKLLLWLEPWSEKFHLEFYLENIAARVAKVQILLRQFAQHHIALVLTLGLSLLFQLLVVFYYYLISQQLKIPISYWQLLVFNAIITVVTFLPISLGGLGVKEGLLAYLFSRVALTIEQAVLLSLTVTALTWLLNLVGGLSLLLDSTGFQEAKQSKHK